MSAADQSHFDYDACRGVLLQSLTETLRTEGDRIRDFQAKSRAEGHGELNAMSLDVLPWHPTITLSFRTSAEWKVRHEPGDWKGYALIGHNSATCLAPALAHVGAAYRREGGTSGQESNHLIQLAAADAILNPSVPKLLQECGVEASIVADTIPYGMFEYVVVDEDRVFHANYCEILIAMRVARRLLNRAIG